MHISKVHIKNYRLLKNTTVDLEEELSLVLGKNNTGKTSLIQIFEASFPDKRGHGFSYSDISNSCKSALYEAITNSVYYEEKPLGIEFDVYIQYDENDNLANLSELMLDLAPENKFIVIRSFYGIYVEQFSVIYNDFNIYKKDKKTEKNDEYLFREFLEKNHVKYFKFSQFSVLYDYKSNSLKKDIFIEIIDKNILKRILSVKVIHAKRNVGNSKSVELSSLSRDYYKNITGGEKNTDASFTLEKAIDETDDKLSNIYENIFSKIKNSILRFGGIKDKETNIDIVSSIDASNLIENGTTVVYKSFDNGNYALPEQYNGLGYLNLINIIFRIEIALCELKKINLNEKESDINILFIEEPEAHTHPQMQYVFIKNIKEHLNIERMLPNGKLLKLQTIMTTHSSHIVSECEFDDIKYFVKDGYSIESRNLKSLKIDYAKERDENKNHYKFLKQYLTLNRSEVFFADKIILIEGDTERILLPAIMKKMDLELCGKNADYLPLLSQHISVVEVGNYSHIYDKFIQFLGIKTLVITDIDSIREGAACRVRDGLETSNASLKHFFSCLINEGKLSLGEIKDRKCNEKILMAIDSKEGKEWDFNESGNLMIAYQSLENSYHARSFEDAFFHINRNFFNEKLLFPSLKNFKKFADEKTDAYELGEECVDKKTSLAMDILLNSDANFSNWDVPAYIREGLEWLQGN